MDPSSNHVSSQTDKGGKKLVDYEKTSRQAISNLPSKIVRGINWSDIFYRHPELSPPGYEETTKATLESVEKRKLEAKQAKEKDSKKKPAQKRKR